jgi:LAO/AO transport system kinase
VNFSDEELISLVRNHDHRAVSRLISLSENRSPRARPLQAQLFKEKPPGHRAHIVGVTGSPGAGKSTLVDQLAAHYRKEGKRVAIVAVDPTSPFTGGAILGDRIRMVKTSEDDSVFIRSMATRGALGGVSRATIDAVHILDAAGFDIVLIETVGVGQAEVDIVRLADTCLVVLVPGMGDSVQAMKAGILEIADLFLINKSDREGADLVFRDLRLLLSVTDYAPDAWIPPIIKTVAVNGEGAPEVLAEIGKHAEWLTTTERGRARKQRIMEDTLLKLLTEEVRERTLSVAATKLSYLALECCERRLDPYTAASQLADLSQAARRLP